MLGQTAALKLAKSALAFALVTTLFHGRDAVAQTPTPWIASGADARNLSASDSPVGLGQLNLGNVKNLKLKWFYPTAAGVSVTPAIDSTGLYFIAQNGLLMKLETLTGKLVWSRSMAGLVGLASGGTTTTPAIAGDSLIIGIGPYVAAIDKTAGTLIWKTKVSDHPLAVVHASPVVSNGHVFTGVASTEEYYTITAPASYKPSFRGSAVSLNLTTGALEWQRFMVPSDYTGGGIWGSSPVADPVRGLVYFTTGNNFTVPLSVGKCIRKANYDVVKERACLYPTDYVDSIVAYTYGGTIRWSRATIGADAWLPLASCADPNNYACPTVHHPQDVDFAQGPSLIYVHNFINTITDSYGMPSNSWVLGAGQKNSVYWGLNPDNGGIFWSAKMANVTGELKWGSAVDTSRNMIYTALDNSSPTLGNDIAGRNGVPIKNSLAGVWSGIDSATGKIVFQVPGVGQALDNTALPANTPGGLAVTNGIVFGGATSGYMAAFDATGFIHWTYPSGGVVVGHPAIYNNMVFWGTGNYKPAIPQTTGLYAFSLD